MKDVRFFPIEIATQVGRISRGQAASWAKSGFFVPTIMYWTKSRPFGYLYSFSDLVALRVISILREQFGMSLADTRVATDYIRADPDVPWSDMRIWVAGKKVHLSQPDGDDVALLELAPIASEAKVEADKLFCRSPDDYGKIERRRGVMHGQPVVKGTRIPVYIIVNMSAQGASEAEILKGYPTLVPEDIRGVLAQVAEQRKVA